jgi:hypothetical protein
VGVALGADGPEPFVDRVPEAGDRRCHGGVPRVEAQGTARGIGHCVARGERCFVCDAGAFAGEDAARP